MSTLAEIESAIAQLPISDAAALQEWLEQWLEDQRETTPDFLASIERGENDLDEGRYRIVHPRVARRHKDTLMNSSPSWSGCPR